MARPSLTAVQIDAFRERACAAALALYQTLPSVSLRQLAAKMGCSHATPYRYFESKEELFMYVRAECFRRFAARVDARLAEVVAPLDRLRACSRAYLETAETKPAEFRLMFQLGQPEAERYPEHFAVGLRTWSIMRETTAEAVAAGELVGDSDEIAHLLWSGIHGIVCLALSDRLRMGKGHLELAHAMTESLIRAYGGT